MGSGELRSLEDYQRDFPDHPDLIAAQYLAVTGQPPAQAPGPGSAPVGTSIPPDSDSTDSDSTDSDPTDSVSSDSPAAQGAILKTILEDARTGRLQSFSHYVKRYPSAGLAIAEALGNLPTDERGDPSSHPATIGPYEIRALIGRGGQALVYEATDPRLGREVALKAFHCLIWSDDARERFEREAKAAARLTHPAIATVFDSGYDGPFAYIAMQLVRGKPLSDLLRDVGQHDAPRALARRLGQSTGMKSPTTARESALRIALLFEDIARALHHAHESGVVHRDVKPGNLMVTPDGAPVLLDFGLAMDAGVVGTTRIGDVFGTPAYMSPEQVRATRDRVDRRTDVYSLGATLYEALAGYPAFEAERVDVMYNQILHREPRRLGSVVQGLPRPLELVVEKAMAKEPGRRYSTALEFADDLRRVRERQPTLARPLGLSRRLHRHVRRHWMALALASMATLVGVYSLGPGRSRGDVQQAFSGTDRERARFIAGSMIYRESMATAQEAVASGDWKAGREGLRSLRQMEPSSEWEQSRLLRDLGGATDGLRLDFRTRLIPPQGDSPAIAFTTTGAELQTVDIATGQVIARFEVSKANCLNASPGGRYWIYSQGQQKFLWDAEERGEPQPLTTGAASRPQSSPDGRTLAYMAPDKSTRLLEIESGNEIQLGEWDGGWLGWTFFRFTRSGRRLLVLRHCSAEPGRMELYDISGSGRSVSAKLLRAGASMELGIGADFSPDERRIVLRCKDGTVPIYDAETLELLETFDARVSGQKLSSAKFHPDGRHVITAHPDRLRAWRMTGPGVPEPVPGEPGPLRGGYELLTQVGPIQNCLLLSDDGQKAWTMSGSAGLLTIDLTPLPTPEFRIEGSVEALHWAESNSVLFVGRSGAGPEAWDVIAGEAAAGQPTAAALQRWAEQAPDTVEPEDLARAWDPVGQRRGILRSVDRRHLALEVDGQPVLTVPFEHPETLAPGSATLVIQPGGSIVALAIQGTLICVDLEAGIEIERIERSDVSALALSPSGQRLAIAHSTGELTLHFTGTLVELIQVDRFAEPVTAVAFSSDGTFLAAGGASGTVRTY